MTDLLQQGARNAIVDCLQVKSEDRVFIMTDEATMEIGQALFNEAKSITTETKMIVWEDYGSRPFQEYPKKIERDISEYAPTVTVFAASSLEGEIASLRHPLRLFLQGMNVRHAHMIGITKQLMETGMQADYKKVQVRADAVLRAIKNAKEITVTSRFGTNLKVSLNQDYKWVRDDGFFRKQGDYKNLPDGEVFTTPEDVNGIFYGHLFGDYFDTKYGVLEEPVGIYIENSRAGKMEGGNHELIGEFQEYIKKDENSDRVGEFAIGINEALKELTGTLLQDEKFPGVHIAFGDSLGEETGAKWSSVQHIDIVGLETNISVDGKTIMKDGQFVI